MSIRVRRQTLALVLGVALPAGLLGGGWLYASVRERATLEREQRIVLERAADAVRAAVDESLEELRRREDARPFYLYNHYYSPDPQDVLALSDPVVVSPLARAPDDPRVVGYFQIDPGGDVRTPYDREPDSPRPALAKRVAGRIQGRAWESTRALAYVERDGGSGAGGALAGAVASLEQANAPASSSIAPMPLARPARTRRSAPTAPPAGNAVSLEPDRQAPAIDPPRAPTSDPSSGPLASARGTAGAPSGPLTVTLGDWGNQLAREISEAQSGDPEANMRVQSRGRVAPQVSRNPVSWEDQVTRSGRAPAPSPSIAGTQSQSPSLRGSPDPSRPEPQSRVQSRLPPSQSPPSQSTQAQSRQAQSPQAQSPQAQSPQAQSTQPPSQSPGAPSGPTPAELPPPPAARRPASPRPRLVRRVSQPAAVPPATDAGVATPVESRVNGPRLRGSPLAARGLMNAATLSEVRGHEVDYTPMRYERVGDDWVLQRVVSHAGAASVQGLLLDEANLVTRWIPTVARRHAVAPVVPRVLRAGEQARCSVSSAASHTLVGLRLCFPEGALAAAIGPVDQQLHLQAGLLLALLVVVGGAVVAIDRAARRSEDLSRQKSSFITAVSHELRTPLTTLRMHAEMLREGLVSEAKRHRFHDDMVQESVRLSRLVENVLEISRLEEGRRPMRLVRSDLASHVRAVVGAQERFAEAKGFTVERSVPDDPVEVRFDGQAMEQIVVNLLDNAVKYAAKAEHKIVRVELSVAGERAVLDVLDRGPGIAEHERERIFERFARAEHADQAHVVGTGLGLALVRELARAQGGDAVASTREGGGARIRVWLPLAPRAEGPQHDDETGIATDAR